VDVLDQVMRDQSTFSDGGLEDSLADLFDQSVMGRLKSGHWTRFE
jgi:hypothetical protein